MMLQQRANLSVNPFSLKTQNLQQPVKAQIDAQFKKLENEKNKKELQNHKNKAEEEQGILMLIGGETKSRDAKCV